MNLSSNIDLSLFTEVSDKNTLEKLYLLNQDNTPEVGSLESIEDLSNLCLLYTSDAADEQ